jgi:hypothetical protein
MPVDLNALAVDAEGSALVVDLDGDPPRRIEPLPSRLSSAAQDPGEAACHALAEAQAFAQFQRRIGAANETRLSRPLVDLALAGS